MVNNNVKNSIAAASLMILGVLLSGHSAFAASYGVANVAEHDSLNMRSGAGVVNEVISKIPHDAVGIEVTGDEAIVGTTRWARIIWEGQMGWVSKYYLQPIEEAVLESNVSATDEAVETVAKAEGMEAGEQDAAVESTVNEDVADADMPADEVIMTASGKTQEVWVLQCGNKAPFWKVQLLPETMSFEKRDFETSMVITDKKQDKNRWNTALKTVVAGENANNSVKMTIKYAYSRRCYDTLSGLRVPYKVTTEFNGEELTGCCRAVKINVPEGQSDHTTLSLNR